jgi:hypothetical protein
MVPPPLPYSAQRCRAEFSPVAVQGTVRGGSTVRSLMSLRLPRRGAADVVAAGLPRVGVVVAAAVAVVVALALVKA